MKSYFTHASFFAPAIVFLLYARLAAGDEGWDTAYMFGGGLALVHGIWLLSKHRDHAIAMGVDLYLLIGGILALVYPQAILLWGAKLGAAAALGCVLAVSLAAAAISPPRSVHERKLAMLMVGATAAAAVFALLAHDIPFVGNVLPVIGLVLVQGALRKRVSAA
ncbi:hypothetical protein LZC95_41610 [Pendulispora brunnea]|uniref:Permease n=1 Tax=Pendulispora brunnea TaxID=2905690 RepID=A0ABZ2K5U4_9BACT